MTDNSYKVQPRQQTFTDNRQVTKKVQVRQQLQGTVLMTDNSFRQSTVHMTDNSFRQSTVHMTDNSYKIQSR